MPSPWVILAVALLMPRPARADAVDELPPGTWLELPDTPMRAACPPNSADYDWNFYCQGVTAAWGGAAIDTTRGHLLVWGGGHNDYRGNEVYRFDLATLAWSRPWGPSADDQIPMGGTHEVYDDGAPGSRHTYAGLTYVPAPHDALFAMGGSLWQSGSFAVGTWRFDLAANAWTRGTDGPAEQGFGDPCVYDPTTGHVFRRANSRMLEYDPAADVFLDRANSDGGFWASNVTTALDPDARLMVMIGGGRVDTYDLANDVYTQDVAITGADVTSLFGDGSPGMDFDPVTQRFVVWGGGLDVYSFDPVTASFSLHAGAGDDPGAIVGSGGAFTRFRYAPSRNVFVWVDHVDANVFVFRMGEGMGEPPPGGTSSGGDDTSAGEGSSGADGTASGQGASASASGDTAGGSSGATTTSGADTSVGDPAGSDADASGGGCSCRTHADPRVLPWLACALPWLRRRRRPRGVSSWACATDEA